MNSEIDFLSSKSLTDSILKTIRKFVTKSFLVEYVDLFCFAQCFLWPPVTIYMLLYSTLLCKKIARAPGGHKRFMVTKLGGDRLDPNMSARDNWFVITAYAELTRITFGTQFTKDEDWIR